jgi:coenzyme F420-reducing hydrogenase beta subunit
VHVKHTDGTFEYKPYFCLPANDLNDVIAPSCYSCFDYANGLADLVVSMGSAVCGAWAIISICSSQVVSL